jgi:Tol biopolymer transport system component
MRATVAISVVLLLGALPAAAFGSGTIAFVDPNREYPPLGQNLEIYLVQPDGSGLTNLTRSCEQESDPDWSPDGTSIAFATTLPDSGSSWPWPQDIALIAADGSGRRLVTRDPHTTSSRCGRRTVR